MSKELTDAKRRAIQKYDSVHTKQYHLKLNTGTDAEIIEHLSKLTNVQGYIKELIKKDIKENKVGHWLPGCVVRYEEATSKSGEKYQKPVYGVCEEGQEGYLAICSECGHAVETHFADDSCPECGCKMIPLI